MAARQAQAEMDPGVSDFQAVFTAIGTWRDIPDLIEMRASFRHG
jgi:hypothetical protein